MKLNKVWLFVLVGVTCLTGCSKFTEVKESVHSELSQSIMETYDNKMALVSVWNKLKELGVETPYEAYNDSYVASGSNATFYVLDGSNHKVKISFDGKEVIAEYTTKEEDKEKIDSAIRGLLGDDVDYSVDETYDGEVVYVHAQGVDYSWKNGILELVQ